ncbi:MAG: metallophosphoesterase family protein [Candidatus Hodarchaeota archaeon]
MNQNKAHHAIVVNPNLGHPTFLGVDPKLKTKNFRTELLIISNIVDIKEFEKSIAGNIQLNPIFDYKWKLRNVIKKKKKKKRVKLFAKEYTLDESVQDFKSEDVDYKLYKLKIKSYRGNSIYSTVLDVKEETTISINDKSYLEGFIPQDYLLKYQVFSDLKKFYRVLIDFKISKEIKKFLKERNFVMFDVILLENQVNFHSIVISKQDWKNFTFIHATDLHLAERNDRIYRIIKKWTESSIKTNVEDFLKQAMKKLKIKKIKQKEESLSEITIPLRKRLINPNNQFRKFIKLMNRKVIENQVDFIILTGDLVDYTILSRLSKKIKNLNEFKYEESNWQTFKNLVLNVPATRNQKGVKKSEELLCPIITTIGNHDYRPYPYDLTWAEMYKKIGLNAAEAIALNEMFSASPISALTKSPFALKGYSSEINPFNDFYFMLGNNMFIFLNSGADSFKNIRDLLTGHPSVTGLSGRQIQFLENLINLKLRESSNTFLFLHGPPINTGTKHYSLQLFGKKGSKILKKKLVDFKESFLKKLGKPLSMARIDQSFNVKYGCISSNWEKLIKFCKDYCILTLSGHTHTLREFRLEEPKEKSYVYDAPPFKLKKIENPAAIFYDIYSEMHTTSEIIEMNKPYIVQTPALGLGGYKNPKTAGAYREIIVKNGKLSSFRVYYIDR